MLVFEIVSKLVIQAIFFKTSRPILCVLPLFPLDQLRFSIDHEVVSSDQYQIRHRTKYDHIFVLSRFLQRTFADGSIDLYVYAVNNSIG